MDNLPGFIKGKKFVFIAGALVLLLIILMIFSSWPKIQSETGSPTNQIAPAPEQVDFLADTGSSTTGEQSEAVKQAIAEQMQADQEYASWQENNQTNYPWLRKLPLTAENYFVYFDLNKKTFIGRLYPKTDENIEDLKAGIVQKLKADEEIPVENFNLDWQVNP